MRTTREIEKQIGRLRREQFALEVRHTDEHGKWTSNTAKAHAARLDKLVAKLDIEYNAAEEQENADNAAKWLQEMSLKGLLTDQQKEPRA